MLFPVAVLGSLPAAVHDNLDSEAVYSVVIGRFWAEGLDASVFDVFLGGSLDWTYFARVLQPISLVYAVLAPHWAYVATEIITLWLAYLGACLLLGEIGCRPGDRRLLACLYAFGLSYTSYGLGLAAAPLVLFLGLRDPATLRPWEAGLAFLCGMNTSLPLHALFLPPVALAVAIMIWRPVPWRRLALVQGFYILGAIIGSAGLFLALASDQVSHRSEWDLRMTRNPARAIWRMMTGAATSLQPFYHATLVPALHTPWVLGAALLVSARSRIALITVVSLATTAILLDVYFPLTVQLLPGPLSSIQFDRIALYLPLLLVVTAGLIMVDGRDWFGRLSAWVVRAAVVVALATFGLLALRIGPDDVQKALPAETWAAIGAAREAGSIRNGLSALNRAREELDLAALASAAPTYRAHFRSDEYRCLKRSVGDGRVISFGVDPMIAPFHGIPAVDGYHNFYPLAYKHAFRPIIAPKLAASDRLARYFDGWGNRVYAFADRAPEVLPDFIRAASLGATSVISDREVAAPGLMQVPQDCSRTLWLYRITGAAQVGN